MADKDNPIPPAAAKDPAVQQTAAALQRAGVTLAKEHPAVDNSAPLAARLQAAMDGGAKQAAETLHRGGASQPVHINNAESGQLPAPPRAPAIPSGALPQAKTAEQGGSLTDRLSTVRKTAPEDAKWVSPPPKDDQKSTEKTAAKPAEKGKDER
jgi:hypothetical protein